MKTRFASALAAAAAALTFTTFAATPVVVWDGDFGTSVKTGTDGKTYTLTLPSNVSVVDGCLSVGSGNQGASVSISPEYGRNEARLSVLMEYEGATAKDTAVPVYLEAEAYFGLKTKGESLDVLGDFWGTTYPTGDDPATTTTMPGSGYLLFVFPQGGIQAYSAATRAGLTEASAGGSISGLSFSNKPLGNIGLGGTATAKNELNAFDGLIIKKVAIFTSAITAAEAAEYLFPSEVQTINVSSDTTVSAINAQYDSTAYKAAVVSVASGVTITVDTAFGEKIKSVSSTGSITLTADAQPDASYFANVDFSGVQGGLLRSWLTPGVVGFNFKSANGTDVSGALATADSWIHDNDSASGSSTALFADGLSTLKWSSANTWACSGSTIISGYLDDGANGGNGAAVTLSNVPYETYDVIVYCSSDSNPGQFLAKTVNGTTYTWDSTAGAVVAGNSTWGKAALSTPVYGVNALRIKNLSGPLTIYGGTRNGSIRGGIAAFQIMPPNTPDNIRTYTLTLNGTATTWSSGTWTLNNQTVDAPASGYVEIVASASTALTVDQAVSLADLKVRGGENVVVNVATNDTGSLYAIKATVQGGVFQQGSPAVLGATPSIVVEDGATFDVNGQVVNEANAFTIAGAGAGNWPWAFTSSGDANPLGTLRSLSLSANATIGGANRIRFGKSNTASTIAFNTFTLTKTGAGELVLCNGRSATNGTGTFDVAAGEVTFNEYTCLDGYESIGAHTTVIVREGATIRNNTDRFIWMDTLNWLGGTVTSTRPFAMSTAFVGSGTTAKLRFASGVQATLTGDLVITGSLELGGKDQDSGNVAFVKAAEINPVTVTVSGTFASSGMVLVGPDVTLNVGVNRPTATITVQEGGTLAAQLQSASDVIALATSAQPANLIVYDEEGVQIDNPRVTYSDGTLTIMAHLPTLSASGMVAFDTAANWEDSLMPGENGDAIIELSGDAEITVAGTYTLGALTFTGTGVATFSGEGTITADNISVKNGATFTRNASISATTGISLDSGTVLRLDGVTESAAISGAGAVETYGTVVLAAANTMTGGITVKPGSALSATVAGGYGEYSSSWAYLAQRQVVVEDGGTVDINYIANADSAVALTVAGKGILSGNVYSGAVTYSGANAITSGSRQISSLVLTDDALIDLGAGWGLVHSGWGNARLGLNGHTLTVRGTGTFPVVNVNNVNGTATTGTLVLDGATLELSNSASNLAGVNVVARGCATINVTTAPSAIGSLTLKPAASGTTATNWNLPENFVPALDTSNVDPTNLSVDDELTLFTAPQATTLTAETISVKAGGRYTTEISGNTVTATVGAVIPHPFLHYDFNNGAAVDTGKASDSKTQIYAFGEASGATFAPTRNGSAVNVYASGYTAYWDTNVSGVSPFAVGEITVTTVAKMKETGVVIWGLGNTNYSNPAMGLVAKSSTAVAVVIRDTSGTVETILTLEGTPDLTKGYHFFAVVANGSGTTLYVDNLSASTDKTVSFAIGQQGQFGSFHGGAIGGSKVGANGYLLDDWRVYDAALTAKEIRALKRELNPDPFVIRFR